MIDGDNVERVAQAYTQVAIEYQAHFSDGFSVAEDRNIYGVVAHHLPTYDNQVVRLLDVGCGYGGINDYIDFPSKGIAYTGIDISDGMMN